MSSSSVARIGVSAESFGTVTTNPALLPLNVTATCSSLATSSPHPCPVGCGFCCNPAIRTISQGIQVHQGGELWMCGGRRRSLPADTGKVRGSSKLESRSVSGVLNEEPIQYQPLKSPTSVLIAGNWPKWQGRAKRLCIKHNITKGLRLLFHY